jgi:hypothetical protein
MYLVREDEEVLTVSVERSGDSDSHVMVHIATHPTEGTATAEEDFRTLVNILQFESLIDVNITILNDELMESNETFVIYLTSGSGVKLSPLWSKFVSPHAQTEVIIIDDDDLQTKVIINEDYGKHDDNFAAIIATIVTCTMLSFIIIAILGLAIAIMYQKRKRKQAEQASVEHIYDIPMNVKQPTKSTAETEETWKENLQYNVAYGVLNRH